MKTNKIASQVISTEILLEAHIPKAHWRLNEDTYFGSELALAQTKHYCKNLGSAINAGASLVFLGPTSTLKTFLICSILKQAIFCNIDCLYSTMEQMVAHAMHKEIGITFNNTYGSPILLAIDDLNESANRGTRKVFLRVLKMRKDAGLPTLIGTSLIEDDILKHFDAEAFAILHESFIFVPCAVDPQKKENHFKSKLIGIEYAE